MDWSVYIPIWLEYAATLTGALSGALCAVRVKYDLLGTMTLSIITGLAGGMLRDILLQDYGIYAFQHSDLIVECALIGIAVFYFCKLFNQMDGMMEALDTLSMALWATMGANKAIGADMAAVPCVILGTITAVGGGVMRDIVMNREVVLFQTGSLYGSAALIGCAVYVALCHFEVPTGWAAVISIALIFIIRYISLLLHVESGPPKDYTDDVAKALRKPGSWARRATHRFTRKHTADRKDSAK